MQYLLHDVANIGFLATVALVALYFYRTAIHIGKTEKYVSGTHLNTDSVGIMHVL